MDVKSAVDVDLPDIKIITFDKFEDDRGYFAEIFNTNKFSELGMPTNFVQFNHSYSIKENTIRGLHFQWDPPMGKLMRVIRGAALLIAVDIRKHSDTFGCWHGKILVEEENAMIWAPAGFARGFKTLINHTEVQYFCSGTYNKNGESGIRWNDPSLNIDWGNIDNLVISEKDANAQTLSNWMKDPRSDLVK